MNKLIPAALAVTAILAISPAFAGETTLKVKTDTTPAVTTTTAITTTTGTPVIETPTSPLKGDPGIAVSAPEVTIEKSMTTGTTDTAEEDTTPEPEAVVPQNYTLKDGTHVLVDAGSVYIVAADNAKTPAPDGDWMTTEGKTLKVKGGLLITEAGGMSTTTSTSTAVTTPAITTTTVTEEKKGSAPQE